MMEGNPCMGHRKYEDVLDADTAGAMWPRGPDGHRTGGRRLLGALPEVRHHGTGAGDVGRSTTSAVGTGGARPETVALLHSLPAESGVVFKGQSCYAPASLGFLVKLLKPEPCSGCGRVPEVVRVGWDTATER
jgi:hypothetical protein